MQRGELLLARPGPRPRRVAPPPLPVDRHSPASRRRTPRAAASWAGPTVQVGLPVSSSAPNASKTANSSPSPVSAGVGDPVSVARDQIRSLNWDRPHQFRHLDHHELLPIADEMPGHARQAVRPVSGPACRPTMPADTRRGQGQGHRLGRDQHRPQPFSRCDVVGRRRGRRHPCGLASFPATAGGR